MVGDVSLHELRTVTFHFSNLFVDFSNLFVDVMLYQLYLADRSTWRYSFIQRVHLSFHLLFSTDIVSCFIVTIFADIAIIWFDCYVMFFGGDLSVYFL